MTAGSGDASRSERRRSRDIQIFSSPSDAPRTRWQTDLVSAAAAATVLTILAIVAGNGASIDDHTLEFVGSLPGWLSWLCQATYLVGVVYVLSLVVGIGIVARDRLDVLRDILLAATVSVGMVIGLSRFVDDRWPEIAFLDLSETRDSFPTLTLAAGVAVQSAASPHLTVAVRHLGAWLIGAATVASVLGGVTTVSDSTGGVLVGLFAAALVRYVFGTTGGIPSINRIQRGLADLGLRLEDLHYDAEQPGVAVALTGTDPETSQRRAVSVLGSDAWNSRLLNRWWRQAWYDDVGTQFGSDRRQQVEHEALVMVLAERGGAAVPELVAVGKTADDDALLVTSAPDATLQDVASSGIDDHLLVAVWDAVRRLHATDVSHGSLDATHVWLTADDTVRLAGFSDSVIHPTPAQRRTDLAATLVTTALLVGADRAIEAARQALGDDELAATLPVVQAASLSRTLRAEAKRHKLKPGALRKQTAAALGIDVPEPLQLARVSWTSVLMMVFVGFAAYTIISGLADVGFDTIVDTLSDARWGLVLLALIAAQATNYTDALALTRVSPKPVPVGVTTIEQFAIGFVNIAVPSAAGRIATNARFFQKFGISPAASAASGAVTGVLGFAAQIVLIVVTILAGSGSIDLSSLEGGGGKVLRLIVLAVAIAVLATLVVVAVPTLRRRLVDLVREPLAQMREALATVRNPRVAIRALGAAMGTEILYGAGFALCVLAMGGSIHLGEAVFINVTVSLFAGLMPIPGGVGVTEAGMTAGLAAIGVPSDIAVGAVLIYRLISYYLPPIWGYVSLRWLTRHDYL